MKNRLRQKLLLSCLAISVTESAFATGFVIPGSVRTAVANYTSWTTSDSLALTGIIDNSYHCRAIPPTGLESVEFDTQLLTAPTATKPTVTLRGAADGGNSSIPETSFSFIANASGTYSINVAAINSSGRAIFTCHNTTLFGNFNTVNAANPVNFLEIKNISNVSTTTTVIVRNFAGTEINRFDKTLTAGERQDIGLHDISGLSNTFGSVQIAHNGGVGGIVANISKYTFDGTTLSITATEGLAPRVQN